MGQDESFGPTAELLRGLTSASLQDMGWENAISSRLTPSSVTRLSDATARGEDASLLATARATLANDPASLFVGVAPRCLLFGATVGGQYLLYDFWTRLFRVSPDDLNLVCDVFADRISFDRLS